MMTDGSPAAYVDGRPADVSVAARAAAILLSQARFALVGGLGADVAGARGAISLAESLRGVFDHHLSGPVFNMLHVLRESGMMLTTPGEVRVRADTIMLVGPNAMMEWPELAERLAVSQAPALGSGGSRRLIWLGSPPNAPEIFQCVPAAATSIPVMLAALRARVAGHPVTNSVLPNDALDEFATSLKSAGIGAVVWAQADLDPLATEMLCGLVFDLNRSTRFSGLPIPPGGNAAGVVQVAGWMTGFPPRTSFARGFPEHDPWRFSAERLIAFGEVDAALWINVLDDRTPGWTLPFVAITGSGARFSHPPAVHIVAGKPGVDHDSVMHDLSTGLFVGIPASAPSACLQVAQIITVIADALAKHRVAAC